MGSEDLVVGEAKADNMTAQNSFLGDLRQRIKPQRQRIKVNVKSSPRNKLPVLKSWLMFEGQNPSNNRHNNRLKARKCCLCSDKGSITCYYLKVQLYLNSSSYNGILIIRVVRRSLIE
jgi:hypothetical protein